MTSTTTQTMRPSAHTTAGGVAGAVLVGLLLALGALASPAAAATVDRVIEVNTTADAPDADPRDRRCDADPTTAGDQCTLRAAIMEANATWALDEIRVPAGIFDLTETGRGDDRIFDAVAGPTWPSDDLELSDLTLRNGTAANRVSHLSQAGGLYKRIALANQAPREHGGAVRVTSEHTTLRLERVLATANVADGRGGAIYAEGRVTFVDSVFEGNESFHGGGAAYLARSISVDDSVIVRSSFTNNEGTTGGAVYTRDTLQIDDSTFTANDGGSKGGAIAAERGVAATRTIFRQNEASFGGAFYSLEYGTLLFVEAAVFEGNDIPGCHGTGHVVRGTSSSDDPTCEGR